MFPKESDIRVKSCLDEFSRFYFGGESAAKAKITTKTGRLDDGVPTTQKKYLCKRSVANIHKGHFILFCVFLEK